MAQKGAMTNGQIVDQLEPWVKYYRMMADSLSEAGEHLAAARCLFFANQVRTGLVKLIKGGITEEGLREKFPTQMSSDPPSDDEEQTAGE